MSTADRLTRAATVLRERAEAAYTPESLTPYGDPRIGPQPRETWPSQLMEYLGGPVGEYAGLMHPAVGLTLADWLDDEANEEVRGHDSHDFTYAYLLANLILGGAGEQS